MDLDRQWTWTGGLGNCTNKVRPDVGLGSLQMLIGFRPGHSNCGTNQVNPRRLVVGLCSELHFDRHLEESFVEVQKLAGVRVESNNIGSQFGFALLFLVSCIDAVEIGIPWFPGKAKTGKDASKDGAGPV
jgi:hypothetical protein